MAQTRSMGYGQQFLKCNKKHTRAITGFFHRVINVNMQQNSHSRPVVMLALRCMSPTGLDAPP